MTVFNAERFLSDSINSLLRQDFKNWELNVVENGSTDQSPEILSKFDDPRIVKRFLPNNIGRTKALNLALSESTAPYVAVLDADDLANRTYSSDLSRQEFADEHLNATPDLVANRAHGVHALAGRVV